MTGFRRHPEGQQPTDSPLGRSADEADDRAARLSEAIEPTVLIESSPDGIVIADADGSILLVNGQIETMFGYGRNELIGQPVEMLVPHRMRNQHVTHRFEYGTDPKPRPMGRGLELRARRQNGTEFPVEISLSPIEAPDGVCFFAALRDVSEKVEAEAESLALLRTIDAAHDGMFMFDPVSLQINYANLGAVNQLGFSRDELLDKLVFELSPELDEETLRSAIEPLIAGNVHSVPITTVHRNSNGTDIPVDIVINFPPALRSDVDRQLVSLVRDISGRRKVEIERDRGVRWLQSLAALRSTLMTDPPLNDVLTLACQQARQLTRSATVAICEPASATGSAEMPAHPLSGEYTFHHFDGGESEALLGTLPLALTDLVTKALSGQLVLADHRGRAAPLGEANRAITDLFDQIMLVPVEGASSVAGLLLLGRQGDQPYSDDEISVASSLAGEAHNAYSLTDARRTKIQVKILEDRDRLARDLHDLIIQRIFAAGLRLQSVQGLSDNPVVGERIGETISQLDETISELRNAIFRLSSPPISVADQLTTIIETAEDRLGFRPTLTVTGNLNTLPATVVSQLDPTLSEALANVGRHAYVSSVDISLVVSGTSMVLTVADDGRGFNPNSPRGNGLDNLEARALRLGGASSVASTTGEGTTLTWSATY